MSKNTVPGQSSSIYRRKRPPLRTLRRTSFSNVCSAHTPQTNHEDRISLAEIMFPSIKQHISYLNLTLLYPTYKRSNIFKLFFFFSDTFASQYDSDHEQWDEPLKRRFSSAPDITKATASTQTLIAVPFCRDPTQPVTVLPAEEQKPSPKVGSNRPAVYKKKPGHAPQSFYHPPEPWSGVRDDTDTLENSGPVLRKSPHSKSMHGLDSSELNPIKELQAMARSTNNMNEDDPPFNFQAMLKRTPRNRASMKRSGESENASLEKRITSKKAMAPPPPISMTPEVQISKYEYTPTPIPMTPEVQIPKYSSPTPPPARYGAPTPPPSIKRTPTREFPRQDSRDLIISEIKQRDCKPEMIYPIIDNRVESEKVELAPGITVEGTVTDL